jgi:glycosyltransferase involved in cell wall biosynthesis
MCEVTIIIPAYNQAHYLPDTIQSVLSQTFAEFEVIIVDDGSTDNTGEVATAFADPRVRYIHQANKGLSGARNTGIAHAQAPNLVFLDADDWLMPQALSLHREAQQKHPEAGVTVGSWVFTNSQGEPFAEEVLPQPSLDLAALLMGNPLPVHGAMVKRAWLGKVGVFDESLRACEDWDLWLRLALVGCPITLFPQRVCAYRMHEGQMTKQPERMRTAMLRVLDKVFSTNELPKAAQALKDKAYATAYLNASGRAYHAGIFTTAKADLLEATRLDPSLLANNAEILRNHWQGWACAPNMKNPDGYLETVYQNLPLALASLKNYRRAEITKIWFSRMDTLATAGDIAAAGKAALRVLYYRPTMFRNRYVLGVLKRYMKQQSFGLKMLGPSYSS